MHLLTQPLLYLHVWLQWLAQCPNYFFPQCTLSSVPFTKCVSDRCVLCTGLSACTQATCKFTLQAVDYMSKAVTHGKWCTSEVIVACIVTGIDCLLSLFLQLYRHIMQTQTHFVSVLSNLYLAAPTFDAGNRLQLLVCLSISLI